MLLIEEEAKGGLEGTEGHARQLLPVRLRQSPGVCMCVCM